MKTFHVRPLIGAEHAGDVGRLLARVAIARGASSIEEVRAFLNPHPPLHNPWSQLFDVTDPAGERLFKAIRGNEQIVIFGDYDVDGITSVVQLVRFLRLAGCNPQWFIPHRIEEDYGLTIKAAARCLSQFKPSLLITVDCGSNSQEAIELLQSSGTDVIVIDHHQSVREVAATVHHLNPHALSRANGDLKRMSAAGLVFFLIQRWAEVFSIELPQSEKDSLLLLAGLGTLVDVMPLVGSNRALVKHSLNLAAKPTVHAAMPGFRALVCSQPKITAWTYAFHIGPILNAAGRILDADNSVNLLLSTQREQAEALANDALRINAERQAEQRAILRQAYSDAEHALANCRSLRVIVVGRESWHPGIVGIVASKLRERYYLPAFVCGGSPTTWKGSGRSIAGFDLGAAVQKAREAGVIAGGGGHAMAAGVRLAADQMAEFQQFLHNECLKLPEELFARSYESLPASGRLAERDWIDLLSALEPFGAGNPRPLIHVAQAVLLGPPKTLSSHPFNTEDSDETTELTFCDRQFNQVYRCRTGLPFRSLPTWNGGAPKPFAALLSVRSQARTQESHSVAPWILKAVCKGR